MLKFGTTERGDAGICFDWIDRMNEVDAAILITKNLTDKFCEEILKFKNKVILHATITGFGGTVFEPNVPHYSRSLGQLDRLIYSGFPREQVVVRVDPIIPNTANIGSAIDVIQQVDAFTNRCRISFINMYPHVIERMRKINVLQHMKYTTFNCPDFIKYETLDYISELQPSVNFELCADISEKEYPNINQVGCVSMKDLSILNLIGQLEDKETPNRKGCLCPKNKIELLNDMHPCAHNCLYCFWKN